MTEVSRVRAAAGAQAVAAIAGLLGVGLPAACSEPCCTVDGFPINLMVPASASPEAAGLRARAEVPGGNPAGAPFEMAIDTGASLTLFRQHGEANQIILRNFDILDSMQSVVRGRFRGIEILPVALDPDPAGPEAVLGGAFLRNFSIQFDFGKPSMTFWSRQGADDGFLSSAGFAVIHFNPLGGAELTAVSRPDFLGLTGPVTVPPTRIVLRACGNPRAFDPATEPQTLCCARGDETLPPRTTGADLALVVATGVGPLVLSQSAWNRVNAAQTTPPPALLREGDLPIPSQSAPIPGAAWFTLPRLALVNQESDAQNNPGACVELGRARRLEWVEYHQPDPTCVPPCEGACAQPCDTDPRDAGKAQNAAAYIEIGDSIPVAVVPDSTPLLQGLRAEVRPEGPEIDGLVGAGVLAQTTLEIDYKNSPARALFACASGSRTTCWTSPRCPRLTNPGDMRACFGMPRARELPAVCAQSGCG